MAKLPGSWEDAEDRGILALPGKYKVVLRNSNSKDSAWVNVIPDPRYEYSKEVDEAHYAALKRLDKTTSKLAGALLKLKESNEVVDKILAQLNVLKSIEAEALKELSLQVKQSLKALMETATGSRPAKQVGAWTSFQVTPQSKISDAKQALRARLYKPSEQDIRRIEDAEQLTNSYSEEVEKFYSNDWKSFKEKVEAAKLSWFRD
jgi:hypothetical protein